MDASGQPSGAASRRRQRRMRSWWRHEQASIAAAVTTALHHPAQRGGGVERRPTGTEDSGNREEVEHATHYGPRAQKTPPPGGAALPVLWRHDPCFAAPAPWAGEVCPRADWCQSWPAASCLFGKDLSWSRLQASGVFWRRFFFWGDLLGLLVTLLVLVLLFWMVLSFSSIALFRLLGESLVGSCLYQVMWLTS